MRPTPAAEALAFAEGANVALCTKELIGEILHADNECFTESMIFLETSDTTSQVNNLGLRVEFSIL